MQRERIVALSIRDNICIVNFVWMYGLIMLAQEMLFNDASNFYFIYSTYKYLIKQIWLPELNSEGYAKKKWNCRIYAVNRVILLYTPRYEINAIQIIVYNTGIQQQRTKQIINLLKFIIATKFNLNMIYMHQHV